MAYLPNRVSSIPEVDEALRHAGLVCENKGKVRHWYTLPGFDKLMLLVASDRLSIFDFILGNLVPLKGAILTATTAMWHQTVLADVPNHLVAYGGWIDRFLPESLRGFKDLQTRAMVCERHVMLEYEGVYRDYLTGSGWDHYRDDNRVVCGHHLPGGLCDGSKLPETIFTPTTKADAGHDLHVTWKQVVAKYPWVMGQTLDVAQRFRTHAESRGIIIADGKLEWSRCGKLCDEWGTPDSSRFWDYAQWVAASRLGRSPAGYDKQPVRDEGKMVETPFCDAAGQQIIGINHLEPTNIDHAEFVGNCDVPDVVISNTTDRYLEIFQRLEPDGLPLEEFWIDKMNIVCA